MKEQRYFIITIGCQMNKSDSERFAFQLEKSGYKLASERKLADLVVVTTCGVRQSAEDRIYGLIPRIKKDNKKTKIIVTGCLVYREDVKKRLEKYVDAWIQINSIKNYELRITNKNFGKEKSRSCTDYLSINPNYSSSFSAFVPIGNGCDNYCSYCVVPYARGSESYRDAAEIIKEVKELVKKGYKEINLIAQNVNSYKSTLSLPRRGKACLRRQGEVNFSTLLLLINDIPGNFWIRFSTSHPKDMSDELIKTIANCEKVCHHIHLPVQAGDDQMLKAMNRKYTVEHYKNLIKKIRKIISPLDNLPANTTARQAGGGGGIWNPPVSITTDTIVGFPGETKAQFNNSKKLYKEISFDMAYLAQYSPRPGTAAAKLKNNVSKSEKKKREDELNNILSQTALHNNKKYQNKTVEILIEAEKKDKWFIGKTRTAKIVRVKNVDNKIKIGNFVNVKIIKAQDFGLVGIKKPDIV